MPDIFEPQTTWFEPIENEFELFSDPPGPFDDIASDSNIADVYEDRADGPAWRSEWNRWQRYDLGNQVARPTYTPADDLNISDLAQSVGFGALWTRIGLPGATAGDRLIRAVLTNTLKDVQYDGTLTPDETLQRALRSFALGEQLRTLDGFQDLASKGLGPVFQSLVDASMRDAMYHDTVNFYDSRPDLIDDIVDNPFIPDEDKDIIFDIGDAIDDFLNDNPVVEEPYEPPPDPTTPPDGYICPPCPSTDCYAPDNIPLLEQILDKLNGLQSDGVPVDLSEINEKIEELSNKITVLGEEVSAGFEQLNERVQEILDLLDEEFSSFRDILETIDTKLDDFISDISDKVEAVSERVKKVWDTLNEEVTITIEATECNASDDSEPEVFEVVAPRIVAIGRAFPLLGKVLQFHSQKVCEIDPTAAVPEWWATRVGADRPQAVISFRAKTSEGKWDSSTYPMSIPWAKNISGTPLIPSYWKGNHYGHLTLPDNSKLIVNCKSQSEAEKMIRQLSSLIQRDKLRGAVERYGKTKGPEIKEQLVYPRYMFYYSTGQKSMAPDWRREF